MKFKNYIETESGIKDTSTSPGTSGQLLSSTITGTSWINQSTINAGNAEHVVIYAKNTSGSQINKGTPVYITGTVGATDTVQIAPADAGNASHMPAVGLLDDTLANNAFGYVITGGFMDNITTDPIDGATPTSNDTVYVKVGGGLTLTKPTGPTGLIQNVAKVGKVSGGNSGSLIVSSILRTNDVPNLTTGKIWVGDGNTVESTVVHLDEVNGRMGIGTTSPSTNLEVVTSDPSNGIKGVTNTGILWGNFINTNSNAFPVGKITLRYGATETASIIAMSNEMRLGGSQSNMTFYASSSEKMRITSSGNVGIGTTSPSEKLDVAGQYGNTTLSGHALGFTRAAGNYLWAKASGGDLRFTVNGNPIGSASMIINSSGNVGIGTTSPSQKLQVSGNILATGNITAYGGANDSSVLSTLGTLQLRNSGSTNVNIQSTGNSYLNGGNVGIGTTNPNSILHITDANPEFILEDTTNINRCRLRNIDGNLRYEADYNSQMGNSRHIFSIDGSEKLRINTNGNVGIGTTSPLNKLQVTGGSIGVDSQYIIRDNRNNTILLQSANTVASNRSLTIGNATYSNIIVPNGNVGIGTTSPANKLHIEGGNIQLSDNKHITWGYGGNNAIYGNNTSDFIKIFTNGAERLIVNSSGNVGIGTTSPDSKLEVQGGDIEVDDSASGLILKSPDGTRYRITVANGGTLTVTAV